MPRINFELNELHAFIAVAEKSSFKAAAESLFLSQPALSRRIEKLEQSLQVRLLERTTRRVSLTEEGVHFLQHAQLVIEELELAIQGLGEREHRRRGIITIASIPSVAQQLLPEGLSQFARRYPEMCLKVIDESAQDVLDSVLQGKADFGINFIGGEDPGIEFEPLLTERYLVVLRHDHPLANRPCLGWCELANEKLIAVSRGSGNRILLDHHLASQQERPRIYYEANHLSGAYGMALSGIGVLIVPELSMSASYRSSLVGIELSDTALTRTLGFITRKGCRQSPPALQLLDILRQIFSEKQHGK